MNQAEYERLVQLHAQLQRSIQGEAAKALERAWGALDLTDPVAARNQLMEAMQAIAQVYGNASAVVAADFYDAVRSVAGVQGRFEAPIGDPVDPARVESQVRYRAGHLFDGTADQMLSGLLGDLQRYIAEPGRRTLLDAGGADKDPPRWARIPSSPDPCPFCLMLASRGWVYLSARSAGEGQSWHKWHSRCYCQIVPNWDRDDPQYAGYDPDALYDRWQKYERTGVMPSAEASAARTAVRKAEQTPGFVEPTSRKDPYWDVRQAALGIETHGQELTTQEIRFVERFVAHGEGLTEWFDQRGWIPTDDFHWTRHGVDVEVKSTRDRYGTIQNAINGSVRDAQLAGADSKQNFIIDIGRFSLTPKLRRQVSLYNERNPDRTVKRLWIMSANGAHLEEIALAGL